MAAASINSAGYVNAALSLTKVIFLSSSGCLSDSIRSGLNSVISSKKSTPAPASVISPGLGILPPPSIAADVIV